jgi:hypothetical protein
MVHAEPTAKQLPKDIENKLKEISHLANARLAEVSDLLQKYTKQLNLNPLDAKANSAAQALTPINEFFSDLSRLSKLDPNSPSYYSIIKKYYKQDIFDRNGKVKQDFIDFISRLPLTIEYLYNAALGTECMERLNSLTIEEPLTPDLTQAPVTLIPKSKLTDEEWNEIRKYLTSAVLSASNRLDSLSHLQETAKVIVTDEKGNPIIVNGKRLERPLFTDKDQKVINRFVEEYQKAFKLFSEAAYELRKGEDANAIRKIRAALEQYKEAEKYFETQYNKRIEQYEKSEKAKIIKQYPLAKRIYYTVVENDYILDIGMAALSGAGAIGRKAAISAGSKLIQQLATGTMAAGSAFFFGRGAESVGMDLVINRKLTAESLVGAAMMASIGLGEVVNMMKAPSAARFSLSATANAARYFVVASMITSEASLIKDAVKYGLTPSQIKALLSNVAFMLMPFVMPKNIITAEDRKIAYNLYKENAEKVLELYKKIGGAFDSFADFNRHLSEKFGPQAVVEMAGTGGMRIQVPLSFMMAEGKEGEGREKGKEAKPGEVRGAEQTKIVNLSSKVMTNAEIFKQIQKAKQTASKIENSRHRAVALIEIAKAQASLGMKEKAAATFKEAKETASKIEDRVSRAVALIEIAKAEASSGMFKEAKETASTIEYSDYRAKALIEIAKAEASAGMFKEAKETASKIENSRHRAVALIEIAKAEALAGMFKEAKETASKIQYSDYCAEAFREIAKAEASSGMFKEAKETASTIEYSKERALALIEIAKAEVSLGMKEEAAATLKEAKQTASTIEDNDYRAEALIEIAKAEAKAGMFKKAKQTASTIENSYDRAEALIEIAKAEAQAGMFKEAKQTASKIEYSDYRIEALIEIAKAEAQAGMKEEAVATLKEAKQTASKIKDSYWRAKALIEIAKAEALAGMFKEAKETASTIEDSKERAKALIEIAKAEALAGMFKEAKETASTIEDSYDRAEALSEIAKAEASLIKGQIQHVNSSELLQLLSGSPSIETIRAVGMHLKLSEISAFLETVKDPAERKRLGDIMYEARTSLYRVFDITAEEKEVLFKKYSKELSDYIKSGKEDEHYRIKLITKILYNLDIATGESSSFALLYNTARNLHEKSDAVNRILYTLAEMDSYKGKDLVLQMIGKGNLDPRVSWLLLNKLSETKYLDPKLPEFYENELKGLSGAEKESKKAFLLDMTKKLITEIRINPDPQVLDFLLHKMIVDKNGKEMRTLDEKIAVVKSYKEEFDAVRDKDILVETLSKDRTKAMLYFILYGGRTRFSLVNNYDSNKFIIALNVASQLKVHEGPLNEFMSLMKDKRIREWLIAGKFPVTGKKYVKEIRVDVSNSEELSSIEKFAAGVFGRNQLGSIIKVKHYISRLKELNESELAEKISKAGGLADVQLLLQEAERRHPELVSEVEKNYLNTWKKMAEKKIFSMSLFAALSNDENKINMKELMQNIEVQRKALEFAVRQQYKAGTIDKIVRDKRIEALQEKGRAKLLAYLLSETVSANTEIEERLLAEWQSHVDQIFQSFERLDSAETSKVKEKSVVLRYLDKRDDLIECLRFADAAQCCFNSKNYRIEGHNVGALEWIARIWKDPLSFVFHIEEPMSGETRNAIGFVFGSFGVKDGKPVVLLNGVYMEGKTKTAVHSILNVIENDFSRPLGMSMQFVGSRYGGSIEMPKDYSNIQTKVRRLRAIAGPDGRPETKVYDDINVGANEEGTSDGNLWYKELK